jgi:hypothetical protein
MPDTTVYIEHEKKLEEADFGAMLGLWGSPIRILVPMVIVDELDGLKQHNKPHVRWRAGYTLAVLDRLFAKSTGTARLHAVGALPPAPDGRMRGEVKVELLFDPPGHVRLPINDDEIVDRALAVEPFTGRPATLLTYDTGQAARARNAELNVIKLTRDIGPEPAQDEPRGRKGRALSRGVYPLSVVLMALWAVATRPTPSIIGYTPARWQSATRLLTFAPGRRPGRPHYDPRVHSY